MKPEFPTSSPSAQATPLVTQSKAETELGGLEEEGQVESSSLPQEAAQKTSDDRYFRYVGHKCL